MKSPHNTLALLNRLWRHITLKRRGQFKLLLVLMVVTSCAEVFSIGAVVPFLGVLTAPQTVFSHSSIQPLAQLFGIDTPDELLLPLTILFCLAGLIAGALRLTLLWSSTRLSFATGADLSIEIYRRTLYQPYSVHIARNSSEVINGIAIKTNNVIHIINMTLSLVSSSVILLAVLFALLSIDRTVALVTFAGFGSIYMLIIYLTREALLINGQRVAHESTQVIKSLQEGLGGIRDVLIDGSQPIYCQLYRDADIPLRRAQGNNIFISASPRYLMEILGIILIAILAYTVAKQPDGIARAIPVLGAMALGAQRLLPILQQAYAARSDILGARASLLDTLALLDQPLPFHAGTPLSRALPFINHISLNNISYRYAQDSPPVLDNINLVIKKGSRVGFIGITGSGKSTLLDIIMGLLEPTDGELVVDGQVIKSGNQRAWQTRIAHVPQTIFLADSTIEENIALGLPKSRIDTERVKRAARQAQIADVIESWPNQYQTRIGERGVRLSGGQRQRIGIARALYKEADVIIFDEATSALDNETEHAVMQAIEDLNQDLTILIIAHRLTTLKNCTQIVELDAGRIKRSGSFQDLINQMPPLSPSNRDTNSKNFGVLE